MDYPVTMDSSFQLPPRPRSIKDVSAEVLNGSSYASSVKEFVDVLVEDAAAPETPEGFYDIDPDTVEAEPFELADPVQRAHLAGLAETLAFLGGFAPPLWCSGERFFLKEPAYVGGRHSRETLMASTPAAFRNRLLFCGPALDKLFRTKPRPAA